MSAREWKPGDVAIATIYGENVRVVRGRKAWITTPAPKERDFPATYCALYDNGGEVHDPRPLVVIDPEDREQVERLRESLERMSFSPWACGAATCLTTALREFADPRPRIEEPMGLGAVVRDTEGSVLVRTPGVVDRPARWADMSGSFYAWADLDVAEILHEGWSE